MSAHQLPSEILVIIFKLIIDESKVNINLPATHIDAAPLIRMTHVCRRWREVAIDASVLWTCFDLHNKEKASAFLDRSRDQPLSLCCGVGPISGFTPSDLHFGVPDVQESEVLVEEHASFASKLDFPTVRLHRLDLEILSLQRTIIPLKDLFLPNLRCLTVSSDYADVPIRLADTILHLPILSGHTDALRALAICPSHDWLPSNKFPNLTHLRITLCEESKVSPRDIALVLSNTLQLEFLSIRALLHTLESFPMPSNPVALPRMRSLVFAICAYQLVMKLVKHLVLPDSCLLRMSNLEIMSELEGDPDPLPPLALLDHVRHMDLATNIDYEVLLIADNDPGGVGLWIHAQLTDEDIVVSWNAWLESLPRFFPLANITTLKLNIHHTHTFWPAVLPHMSQVEELSVIVGKLASRNSEPMTTLCALLSQEQPVLFPALHVLRVQGTLSRRCTEEIATTQLASMLGSRARLGHRVRRLDVQLTPKSISGPRTTELYAPLREHVDVLNVTSDAAGSLCEFTMRGVWADEGMVRYWTLGGDEATYPTSIMRSD